jgi:ubiquinone biosynthesis monooxygenase Coq6
MNVQVGADGPNSPVRKFSEIDTYLRPYPTHAIVATLHHPTQVYPNNTAFQRFLPTGPLAFLPLSPTSSTMVWSTTPSLAAAYKRLKSECLTLLVNAGFQINEEPLNRLNDLILNNDAAQTPMTASEIERYIRNANINENASISPDLATLPPTITSISSKSIASFPLRLSHASSYTNPEKRTILVGDAAHTIHPLAGQGLNMGLADVRALTDVWERTKLTGGDLGSGFEFRGYTRERYAKNQLMLTTTDALHHIFGSRNGVVNWVRGVGLEVINELGPVKKILMGGAGATVKEKKHAGWGSHASSGLEDWLGFKHTVGTAAGLAGEVAKNGLRAAVNALDRK